MMKLFFVTFFVILNSIFTNQQNTCILPGGTKQSICVRSHYCNYFQDEIRKYNGYPPPEFHSKVASYICDTRKRTVCCPDNAIDLPQTSRSRTVAGIDFNAIINHRNINLVNDKSCGALSSKRIVGGENAVVNEFRWAALLGYSSRNKIAWKCGGTLITQRFVLTAFHCATKELFIVRLGEHTISKLRDCDDNGKCADPVQDILIENKIKHPQFDYQSKQNDIALLKLKYSADLTKNNVRTICLPITPDSDIEEYRKEKDSLIVTGWGKIGGAQSSDILQKAFLPLVDLKRCNAIFDPVNIKIYPTQLCAGYSMDSDHEKTDNCKGDSGGGLIANYMYDDKPKALLYGVVTGGIGCEDPNIIYPGIYANVRNFLTWILDNISE